MDRPSKPANPLGLGTATSGVIRTVAAPTVAGVLVLLAVIGLALATWTRDERRSRP